MLGWSLTNAPGLQKGLPYAMDQYSPTYSNDRTAKDQTAMLVALGALFLAAVAVVFGLAAQGTDTRPKDQITAVAVTDMQRPSTAIAGAASGVLVAPADGVPLIVGGATKENYPWIKGKVTALLQTDVGLWAATAGNGDLPAAVNLIRNPIGENSAVQQIVLPPNFAGAEIRALVQGAGRLYIGTSRGLLTWDFNRLSAFAPPSRYRLTGANNQMDVTSLYLDGAGTLWIGTREGLMSYNGTESFRHTVKEGLPSNVVTAVTGDGAGLLYVGTDKGLVAYDRGVWVRHSEVEGQVNAVLAAEDNVWVGTTDGLYQRLEGRWAHFTEKANKLPDVPVTGLAWSGDGIYVLTEKGLFKFAAAPVVAAATEPAKTEHGTPAPIGPAAPAHH